MSGLCRICMFPKFDLINLAKDGTDTLERSGEKFEDCFGIKVKELPFCQRICKDCDKQLIDFYYFKQQALRTHNYMIDKACDLQTRCAGIKEDMDVNNVETIDNTLTIKPEKDEIEYTEDTFSEVFDSYKQIAPLMYEVANESMAEDKIEIESIADNTKDYEGEDDKMIKEYRSAERPELQSYCRRLWGTQETIAFLRAYEKRKDEFLHFRKKKIAMQNVLADLTAQNLLDQPATVEILNSKLKNLLRSYKSAKDNVKSTPPGFAPFAGIMERIFGEPPIVSNGHTLNLCEGDSQAHESSPAELFSVKSLQPPATQDEIAQSTGRPESENSLSTCEGIKTSLQKKTRKHIKGDYHEKKIHAVKRAEERLEMFRQMQEAKEKRFQESQRRRAERHKEKINWLNSYFNIR